jgi:phosphate-selective porin OprO/OprP
MHAAAKGSLALSLLLVASLSLVRPAAGQEPKPQPSVDDLEKRVRELEDIVRRLEAERSTAPRIPITTQDKGVLDADGQPILQDGGGRNLPAQIPGEGGERSGFGGGAAGSLAGWDDGFFLRSADRKYVLRITGQIQADYRAFLDGQDTTDIDTFLVRRARLGIEANMFEYYEFRLLPDFSNAQAPGTPASTRLQDAYMNVHYWDAFQVEAGKFKQPFSYEQLIQDRFVPTMERSLIDQLVPARDEGVMVHGQKLFGDRLDYGFSVSNGEINGDFDQNDRKDVVGRVVVRPFRGDWAPHSLQYLQLGVSGATGFEQELMNPNPLRTPATIPWFRFNTGTVTIPAAGAAPAITLQNNVFANGLRSRWSPELSYFYRGFGFASQYLWEHQRVQLGQTGPTSFVSTEIPFTGYYVLATLLLTGEDRTTYSAPITPLRPFDPCHACSCAGAWELVARVSRLDLDQDVFTPFRVFGAPGRSAIVRFADPLVSSPGCTEMTLGFNWYLNKWVRMQMNYERSWFDHPVLLGLPPRGLLTHDDAVLTRFQVIF